MESVVRVLAASAAPGACTYLLKELGKALPASADFLCVHTLGELARELQGGQFQLCFIQDDFPSEQILDFLQGPVCLQQLVTPVVIVGDSYDAVLSRVAAQQGVYDYLLTRELAEDRLLRTISFVLNRKATEQAYRDDEQRYHALFEAIADGVVTIDHDGRIQFINPAVEKMFGYSASELLGKSVDVLMPGHEQLKHHVKISQYLGSGKSHILGVPREVQACRKDGTEFPLEILVTELDIGGRHLFSGVVRDISQRKYEKEQLRLLATTFESHAAIMITDKQANILKVNPAFTKVTGYTAAEVTGKNPRLLASGKHDTAFFANLWQQLEQQGNWEGEIWNRRKNGKLYPQWQTITAVKDDDGQVTHYVSTFQDISERKRMQEIIEHQAFYDALTNLPNRRMLLDRLKQELSLARRHNNVGALLFLDLDVFKEINDSEGHDAGDMLLQQVAERLKQNVRMEDTIARFGGDEFVVLLPHLGYDEPGAGELACQAAEKIRLALAQPHVINGKRFVCTCSMGVALYPGTAESADHLIKQADTAMYEAKGRGGNAFNVHRQ